MMHCIVSTGQKRKETRMTKPHMTLPNGDVLYEGDYGIMRDGRKVGPLVHNSAGWRADNKVDSYLPLWLRNGVHDFFPEYNSPEYNSPGYDIIAKHVETDTTTLWRDMTGAEKGALLLAAHEGKVIEHHGKTFGKWFASLSRGPLWADNVAYRIEPEPKVETVVLYGRPDVQWVLEQCNCDTHSITFNLIDGKPDCDSIKMFKMPVSNE